MSDDELREFLHFLNSDGWMFKYDVQTVLDRYEAAKEGNWYPLANPSS